MPNPPRMLVLASPFGSHAKPNRGAQLFVTGKLTPFGAPLSPGNTSPGGAPGNTVDWSPGITENVRPSVSYFGLLYSYRSPSESVSLFVTRHSSWKNPYTDLLRMLDGAAGPCWKNVGMPHKK